jgi:cytochrome c553
MIRKLVQGAAVTVGALVVLVLVALGVVYVVSQRHIDEHLKIAGHQPRVPTDSAGLARGLHVATALSKCAECHGKDLGGKVFIDAAPVAHLYAMNLTRGEGGIGGQMSDLDWERAIRHGVAPDGRKLLMMPAYELQHLNDDDLGALIAYVKSVPPVNRSWPAGTVGPVGRVLYLKGDIPLLSAEMVDHAAPPPAAVPPGPTLEFGRYVVTVGGCKGCHGETLSGGHIPGTPPEWKPPANITPKGIGRYTEADFFHALRDGVRPPGTPLDTVYMPVRWTRLMSDDEIRAVFMFLKTVPPKEYGGR